MDIYEEYIEGLIQLAEEAIDDDNLIEAKNLLVSGLMEEPGYPKLHYIMGRLYHYDIENPALAERHYQLAIKFDSTYESAYADLAWLYIKKEKYKGLKYWMKKAKKVDEISKAFVYENLGKSAEAEKRYTKAIKHFKKALIHSLNDNESSRLKKHIKRNKYKTKAKGGKQNASKQ